jgi:putative tryptophan/tyrosine transport system substrate-binding protein
MAIHIRRREFILTMCGGAAAMWSRLAPAQSDERMRRIAMLMNFPANDPEPPIRIAAFLEKLLELGWTDGRNVRIEYRSADNHSVKKVAAELTALAPDILVVNGSSVLKTVQQTTRTTPIVFVNVVDPVGQGFIQSLAHPGGNITGVSNIEAEIGAKWLQLLKEIAPQVTQVAVIGASPKLSGGGGIESAIESVAPSLGVKLIPFTELQTASEIEHNIYTLARRANTGLLVLPGPITIGLREMIIELAAGGQLPAVYPNRFYVTSGGLVSYGVNTTDAYRRAAAYADRILKGEKPADLQIDQQTMLELTINLKTAKMLGLVVPPTLLARADEVIE